MKGEKSMSESFVGYEYQDITVKRSVASAYADGYESFGWRLDGTTDPVGKVDSVSMKFKRDRKIANKAELSRLQRQFDACFSDILSLEGSKVLKASVAAYVIGVIGTVFMAGSVFAYTGGLLPLSIVLAVPGLLGWVVPYLVFSKLRRDRSTQVAPLIDGKYDEVYAVCERASGLLEA